jgi:hypothetical protein
MMRLPRFKYISPANRAEGLDVLQAYGSKAKILAEAHKIMEAGKKTSPPLEKGRNNAQEK